MMRYLQAGIVLILLLATGDSLFAQLSANFSSDTTSGCAPLIIRFSDRSAGSPVYWRWELGNGTVSFSQNPSTTYFAPGTYSVKLYVRSSNNQADSISKTQYITVYSSPVVNFKSSDTSGCYPLTVQYTDLSTAGSGSIINWEWDFGDGTTSNLQNPVHTYADLGKYNVTLRIRNSNGCFVTLSRGNYINVNNGVKAAFDLTSPDNCRAPAQVIFRNQSTGTGTVSYKWIFGDGSPVNTAANPSHTFTAGGSFAVKLVAQNNFGCIDSVVKQNAVTIGNVSADFNMVSNVCVGRPVLLTNNSSPIPVKSTWTFPSGLSSDSFHTSTTFANPGFYQIKLLSDFGSCKDSITKTIQVLAKPKSAFSAAVTGACRGPLTVAFSNESAGAVSYLWQFGDGSTSTQPRPSHTYTARGSYDVTLISTNANGCSDTLKKPGFVKILPPVIQMQNLPYRGCAPLSFEPKYTIESVDAVSTVQWDFGDGTGIVTGGNPVHQYVSPGNFTLKSIITTRSGCVDTIQFPNTINVGILPKIDFSGTPREACAFQPVLFTDLSTGSGIDEWFWDFGDDETTSLQNPAHLYQDTGRFTVKLRVGSNGCITELAVPDYITIKAPIAKFTDSSGCASPLTRKFSSEASIDAQSWFWDFGDGTTSSERHPTHSFPATGNYIVRLTVKNDTCENTAVRQISIIKESPDFSSSDSVACKGASVQFVAKNINRSNIAELTWAFGDGFIARTDTSVFHRYSTSGQYAVSLRWTDITGCTDSIKRTLFLQVTGPTAGFTSSQPAVCVNGSIEFTDQSKAGTLHPITQWVWSYGDGKSETLTSAPFTHTYTTAGAMLVSLKVVDSKGCTDSIAKSGLIFIAKPVAAFQSQDTLSCLNALVSFVNTSTGNPVRSVWNFGDLTPPSMALQPTHRYQAEGKYAVSLAIVDQYGCKDSISKTGFVSISMPHASFSVSDSVATCPPLVSTFTNRSTYFNFFEFDFGDGNRSTLSNPVHFYNFAGVYPSRLIVVSPGGCRDTAYKDLVVRGPQGDFVYDKIAGCTPLRIRFTAHTKDNVSFVWDYSDGSTDATADSVVDHEFVIRGKYLPKMILIDPQGCKVPITAKDSISVYGVNALFSPAKSVICDSGLAVFTDLSTSNDLITSYAWTFGDGGVSSLKNPSHYFGGIGDYPVNLSVTTLNGCVDAVDRPIEMKVVAKPSIAITGTNSACLPALVSFAGQPAVPDNTLQWAWDFGFAPKQTGQQPAPVNYSVAGTYPVQTIATNGFGCSDTANLSLVVHPIPLVNAGPDDVICLGQDYTLRGQAQNYQWASSTSLSCSTCANPVTRPSSSSVYILTTTDAYGCQARDSVIISVKQPFTIQASLGDTLCLGKSLALFARGAELFTWSPALGLNNPQLSNPIATPQTTTTYMVIGRDSKNCFADTALVPIVVYNYPTVSAGDDKTIQVGDATTLKLTYSPDVISWLWQPAAGLSCLDCPEQLVSPKNTTNYSVTVANQGGCEAKDDVRINVICKDGNLFMPNTFSPNGDGVNDMFYPRGKGIFGVKSMKIFNRWGELIFQQYNFKANDGSGGSGWNGRYNGRNASQDVYVYLIEIICENSQVLSFKGDVTLIR